jgi:hypothetical protein
MSLTARLWRLAPVASLALLAPVPAALAATPVRIDASELIGGSEPVGLVDNAAFTPSAAARAAREPFEGELLLSEVAMRTEPAELVPREVLGRDPRLFPAVSLGFMTIGGDLVPATQEVVRAGSTDNGHAYWDVIVQPGRLWSEPGDGGWSRAAFPFALVHSLEGETHNGIATFLYRRGAVSALRFQIVQQTTPFNVSTYFTATGVSPARYRAARIADHAAIERAYRSSLTDALSVQDWSALAAKVGSEALAGFASELGADEVVLAGLDYAGTFYVRGCASAAGPLPWCDRMRFGVWSVTKAFANELALLRLAQKYGPGVFELRVADYVPEAAGYPHWRRVRFDDCINMATGVGNGSVKRDPNDSGDGYIDATYAEWANTGPVADKLAKLLRFAPAYPWGPGEVVRYRDQDMFILGVAMDRFLKEREGPSASLWAMLQREVFGPIGIHDAPTNRTIEPGGAPGQPLMAYGYYATIGDLVKVARLYHEHGLHRGQQILYAPRIEQLLYGSAPRGLPTGIHTRDGELLYFNAFWHMRYRALDGCDLYLPQMFGWGGNFVALYPGGLTAIRIGRSPPERFDAQNDTTATAVVANRLARFCRSAPEAARE